VVYRGGEESWLEGNRKRPEVAVPVALFCLVERVIRSNGDPLLC